MNNTHYNLIDTFNHLMGREKFTAAYNDFMDNFFKPMQANRAYVYQDDLITAYQDAKGMPRPVAATFVDCFMWISKDLHKGGGNGYGLDLS